MNQITFRQKLDEEPLVPSAPSKSNSAIGILPPELLQMISKELPVLGKEWNASS
jgi:hypothetical protein